MKDGSTATLKDDEMEKIKFWLDLLDEKEKRIPLFIDSISILIVIANRQELIE